MIDVAGLTKRYGPTWAVDDLTFTVRPGIVTGFLGPNGAGKSTTLRMVLGLDRPTAGTATIDGTPFARLPAPVRTVGALLDAQAVQPYRTARQHLDWIARAARIDAGEIPRKLELVGLAQAVDRRIGDFSLGMRQRLGLAAALLGDPTVLILDEPTNGLDPDGIAWLRRLLRSLADEGRTVFLSSHLMGEMEHTADRVVVINEGRFVADMTIPELTARTAGDTVVVSSPEKELLITALRERGATVDPDETPLRVTGLDAREVGDLAFRHQIPLHELRQERTTLEEAFMQLTHERPGRTSGKAHRPQLVPVGSEES
ncbi:MAG: ABC transporter ATP-binding protein [Propionibacteriaceae bacterium]